MSKHTPGPWFACCAKTEAHYVFGPNVDETICEPKHNDPRDFDYEPACGIVTKEERCANALLIASAPEMLSLLMELKEARGGKKNVYGCAEKALDVDYIERVEAVIANATGQ